MDVARILIVEDDPLMSMHLEALVAATVRAEIVCAMSAAEAWVLVEQGPDYALLDVDVTDGTTYAVASRLAALGIPFVFISASDREHLPPDLRHVPFVAKPYDDAAIVALLAVFCRSGGG